MIKNKLFDSYYTWWKNIDKIIFSLIVILFLLGLLFSLASTSIIASDKLNTNSYYFFIKHFTFVVLSFFVFVSFSFLKKEKLIVLCLMLFLISFIFLLLVPFIGNEVKGSKRWIEIAFLPRFQPIEFLKPTLIVSLGALLSLQTFQNLYFKYLLSFIIILPVVILLILQPDIGQTILVISTWLSLIFISGINLILFSSSLILLTGLMFYMIFFVQKFSYIKLRLTSFLNQSSGDSYQSEKASEAIINGGFFGKGVGEGTLNSKIPEAHTDYIVSVISEEFGIVIIILIMLIYLLLSYKILKNIDDEKDTKVKLILLGCAVLILLQSFIHIGVNIKLLPTTGMTLPFLSYGGSSIISTAIISGIILNFTKRKISY